MIRLIRQTPLGSFLPGPAPVIAEHIEIMPREVATINGDLLNFVPSPQGVDELDFIPMVTYFGGLTQLNTPNGLTAAIPVEALKVMPRVVPAG